MTHPTSLVHPLETVFHGPWLKSPDNVVFRLTARRKYHSPGTVSCQDFHQAPTPIIAKPFLTPGIILCPLYFKAYKVNI